MQLAIKRVRNGRSFNYFLNDEQITDKDSLNYFKQLYVPPAWKDVRINRSRKSKILATGFDKAGRLQYIYHPTFRARQEQEKFERILRFGRTLPRMRQITAQHLKRPDLDRQKVLACIVRLIDEAHFRVGNDVYAKENESYGLTTIRSKHVSVRGDTITFDFVGKSGQKQTKRITNRSLAQIVKRLDKLPGYEIFKYYDELGELKDVKSDDVNAYIKELMGEEFTAKDFRTWAGTLLASIELAQIERSESEHERKKMITACIRKVARKLGNTPAIARSAYIDPRILKAFLDGDDLRRVRQTITSIKKQQYLSADEQCVLKLLKAAP